jgi:hypothetical protein
MKEIDPSEEQMVDQQPNEAQDEEKHEGQVWTMIEASAILTVPLTSC